eukprot:scaffold147245_cov18-Tisochrysis_lutea.AAC.1
MATRKLMEGDSRFCAQLPNRLPSCASICTASQRVAINSTPLLKAEKPARIEGMHIQKATSF